MNWIKQILCDHSKLGIAIDLDVLVGDAMQKAKCICGKRFEISITAYSIIEDINPKKYRQCTKRMYSTKVEAETVLNWCRNQTRKKQPTKVYACPICKFWHLTSK